MCHMAKLRVPHPLRLGARARRAPVSFLQFTFQLLRQLPGQSTVTSYMTDFKAGYICKDIFLTTYVRHYVLHETYTFNFTLVVHTMGSSNSSVPGTGSCTTTARVNYCTTILLTTTPLVER